jgi:hypothetical protein
MTSPQGETRFRAGWPAVINPPTPVGYHEARVGLFQGGQPAKRLVGAMSKASLPRELSDLL